MLAACGGLGSGVESERVGTARAAILNGERTDQPAGAVVIGVAEAGERGIQVHCSGTLLTPTLVLTARHCVDDFAELDEERGIVCERTRFTLSRERRDYFISTAVVADFSAEGSLIRGAQWIRPPVDEVCGADIALLELSDPVPPELAAPIAPRVETPVEPAESFYAVGFGKSAFGQSDAGGVRRRSADLSVTCVADDCDPAEAQFLGTSEWLSWDTGVCPADSGGPALDAEDRVIGVASRGPTDCSFTIYGSITHWRSWLQQEVLRASERADSTAPAWATASIVTPSEAGDSGAVAANLDAEETSVEAQAEPAAGCSIARGRGPSLAPQPDPLSALSALFALSALWHRRR